MPAFEGKNSAWRTFAGGYFTKLPIVSSTDAFARLDIERDIPGMDAPETSSYKLIHKPEN
ncbi:MAG: hypothetical protein N2D54_10315 [Chloroflexota bacterium]